MAHKNLQKLFDKKMGRREFLAHIGAGALAIIGISGLMKTLLNYSGHPRHQISEGDYGASAYGGISKQRVK